MKKILWVSMVMSLLPVWANADGMVRITCEDADAGAEITVNGRFAGECSADVSLAEGIHQLRVRKVNSTNPDYEQIFEKQLRVAEGGVQRIEVVLSASQLTTEAVQRKKIAEARSVLEQAEAGNVSAMGKLASYYDEGKGVAKDPAKAHAWRQKMLQTEFQEQFHNAKANGNVEAMKTVADYYEVGRGVEKNVAQANFWRDTARQTAFDAAMSRAESGDVAAMREVAKWYNEPQYKGRNATKARLWNEKADTTERENTAREAAQQKAAEKQAKIDGVHFFEWTAAGHASIWKGDFIKEGCSEFYTALTFWTVSVMGGLASDATSAPFKTTQLQLIKNEAAMRPSTWGKPDSMMARVSQQYEHNRVVMADAGPLSVAE